MTYNCTDLYKIFDDTLTKEIGIRWSDADIIFHTIGNAPGIYPDSLLLITRMIKKFPIKSVTELGSGFSTLYFTKLCKDINIDFISYEECQKWSDKTRELLDYYHLDSNIIKLDNINNINYNTGLLFIDCKTDTRCNILESDKINNIPFIIVDDCQIERLSRSCSLFMCNSKRYKFYIYNGIGRKDRHLFINSNFDIKEFVDKEMICLGN